jgi:hypothetical protein
VKQFLLSGVKLIASVSIGVFLSWFFLKNLSKEKQISAGDLLPDQSGIVAQLLVDDSTLVHYGQPLCLLETGDGEKTLNSPYEGLLRWQVQTGAAINDETTLATSRLDELKVIRDAFSRVNYWWIALALLCGVLSHLSRAMRWRLLIDVLGHKPKLTNLFGAVMIGYFANLAFPRLGELTKCGVIKRYEKISVSKLVGTILIERAVDVVCLLLVFAIAILSQMSLLSDFFSTGVYEPLRQKISESGSSRLVWIVPVLLIAAFIGLLLLFRKSEHRYVLRMKEMLRSMVDGMITIVKLQHPWWFIFHSVFIWVMYFLMVYVCFRCLPETSHLGMLAAMSVLAFGSLGIIAVQGGIGAYPVLAMLTLFQYGLSQHMGFAFGWIVWTAQTALVILLGIIAIIVMPVYNRRFRTNQVPTAPNPSS